MSICYSGERKLI